jgi:hypothetical protein
VPSPSSATGQITNMGSEASLPFGRDRHTCATPTATADVAAGDDVAVRGCTCMYVCMYVPFVFKKKMVLKSNESKGKVKIRSL